jgi:hypothetical protein
VRRARGQFPRPSDPAKVVAAVVDLVDSGETPLRLPLEPDTYRDVRASLAARLAEHEAHEAVALSVAAG